MADRNPPPPVEAEPVEPVPPPTAEGADPPPAPEARRWSPPRPGPVGLAIIVLLVIGAIVAILLALRVGPFAAGVESTENAYVRGQVTIVSPQVNGYVVQVPVQDFANVEAGTVLARIDDRIYRQRVEQARANLATARASLANNPQDAASRAASLGSQQAGVAAARAQLARAQADNARVEALARQGFVARRDLDVSRAALRQAQADLRQAEAGQTIAEQDIRSVEVGRGGLEAGVEAAEAALRLAEIDLANTVIRAPVAGQLGEIGVRQGQYVTAGTQLMSLVPHQLWVIANFKEAQTARIRPGAAARFRVDALGGERLTGHVEELSPAAGSEFAVIRPDNASGNFVKVPQRIAVRIRIDPDQPAAARLRPGMSVEAEVELAR
ncbi:multidrug resistance efflux pump [Sphingomonas naasensis]|uniref:HlyD family secretion protein n=1 Tax=Sphingomonas naasensis TaxID=1344951 RepID=A0A4S1WMP1_9SPHN|nr:HlyD family secretion protein [Sphingomonas naasensis]NIJ21913.1 multidrug resistance efflux pump [Sphingomonas naasensis]TGX42396.1 HlyD family secretion protein [Sphingomonas naasensis]